MSIIRTIMLLLNQRPKILFVQNPSAFLTLLAIFLKPFFRYKLVVDAHNAGVYPSEPTYEKYRSFFTFMHRHADLTIVTNNILAVTIEKNGGVAAILPDPLPDLNCSRKRDHKKDKKDNFIVTLVCSYASDEPYLEVFKAAAQFSDNIRIYVTGDDRKLTQGERELARSNRVTLTGFLSEDDYIAQLCRSDSIMVLTKRNDCMVCGAYEAVSLEKPLILSDSNILQMYFNKGCVFTSNETLKIYDAVLKMQRKLGNKQKDIKDLKKNLIAGWRYDFSNVCHMFENHKFDE